MLICSGQNASIHPVRFVVLKFQSDRLLEQCGKEVVGRTYMKLKGCAFIVPGYNLLRRMYRESFKIQVGINNHSLYVILLFIRDDADAAGQSARRIFQTYSLAFCLGFRFHYTNLLILYETYKP